VYLQRFLLVLAMGLAAFGLGELVWSWRSSRDTDHAWYSVEQLRAVTTVRGLRIRGVVLLIVGGALLAWLLFNPPDTLDSDLLAPAPTASSPMIAETPMPVASPTQASYPINTPTGRHATVSPVAEEALETPLVEIPTPDLRSQAVVTNTGGGGLWLRDAPFGGGLMLLPEGSAVYVRGGLMEVDGIMWQNVVEPEGRAGWVAADYLIYR
jgi:hypothetical protein